MKISVYIDCIAVIAKDWGQEIVGQNILKRDLSLTDEKKECILATSWSSTYNEPDYTGTCVLIHNGVIHEFNGLKSNPDIEMAGDLKSWFDEEMSKIKD